MVKLAVVGGPALRISRSPEVHGKFGVQCEISVSVDLVRAHDNQEFRDTMRRLYDEGYEGSSVAQPFKETAANFCDELTPRAKFSGAVNAIKIMSDRTFLGDNTDGVGLLADIKKNFRRLIKGQSVLIIGAGGVAHGLLYVLLQEKPNEIVLVNRTRSRAEGLAASISEQAKYTDVSVTVADFCDLTSAYDLIINTTSSSLDDVLPGVLASEVLSEQTLCYDVVFYPDRLTAFEAWASEHGAEYANGIGMGIEQGAQAFYLWTGLMPNTNDVLSTFHYHRKVADKRFRDFLFFQPSELEKRLVRSADRQVEEHPEAFQEIKHGLF